MSTSCSGLMTAYVDCLRQTACYKVIGRGLGSRRLQRVLCCECAAALLPPTTAPSRSCLVRAKQERKRTVTQCAEELPEECNPLRYALFACKRGQMDARTRIQGNKGY